jgi:glycogen debranching enzyme
MSLPIYPRFPKLDLDQLTNYLISRSVMNKDTDQIMAYSYYDERTVKIDIILPNDAVFTYTFKLNEFNQYTRNKIIQNILN